MNRIETKEYIDSEKVKAQDKKSPKDRVIERALQTVQEISRDTEERLKGAKSKISFLSQGVYYESDYYIALRDAAKNKTFTEKERENAAKRLSWFIEKNKFYNGIAPSEYFDPEFDQTSATGIKRTVYVLKKGKLPSEALKALKQGLTILGCSEVCLVGIYEGLQDVLGQKKFDTIFSECRLRISDDYHPLVRLLETKSIKSAEEIEKGQIIYLNGAVYNASVLDSVSGKIEKREVDLYPLKHFWGDGRGFNTMCSDAIKKIFVGFGLNPDGCSQKEISEVLFQAYNTDALEIDELVSEELAGELKSRCSKEELEMRTNLKTASLKKVEFEQMKGGSIMLHNVVELNGKRIQALADAPMEKVVALFKSWK